MLRIQEYVPLAPLTTFKIGGSARYFAAIKTEDDLRESLAWARDRGLRFFVLAGKSNVLVPDEGLDGLVISVATDVFSFTDTELAADSGCVLLSLIIAASEKGLGGWEKLAGIPGTLGGAVRGNAGAFGSEIKDVVTKVRALHAETGEIREFVNSECTFSYRYSFFKIHPEWIIMRVSIQLNLVDTEKSTQLIKETISEREKRHIQNVQAAGSYFMNPVAPRNIADMFEKEKNTKARGGRVPAGWLIEKSGMKGARVGDAVASPLHPNYLVNAGSATAQDVLALAHNIKSAVKEKFDITLQEEAV
ncbi:MAG: UDP-N-acetylmuramate dehydrogenase, partial [Patescibacteria group bacterium]